MTTGASPASTQTIGLDHVNIQTRDIEGTARFLQDVLGLVPKAPAGLDPAIVCWMYNAEGAPIFHIVKAEPGSEPFAGKGTGPIHHVAVSCKGHAAMCARLEKLGIEYRLTDFTAVQLRQIFIHDPNGIQIELNFYAGSH